MADTLDIITLAEGKTAANLNAAAGPHDTKLAQQITAISRIIDSVCGPVVVRTITGELHRGGRRTVRLRHYPVTSITTVKEARWNGTPTTLSQIAYGGTTDGYRAATWPKNPTLLSGELRRTGNACNWWPGQDNIQVTYVAGRFADTASVDAQFKECAGEVLRRLWKRESGIWAQASEFFEGLGDANEAAPGSMFFKAVKPVVDEILWDEVQSRLVGFR